MQDELIQSLGVVQSPISMRLKALGMIQRQGNWIPNELKPRDLERRFFTCEQLLEQQKWERFLHRVVTANEKLIHYDNPKRKKSWDKPSHPSISMVKANIHDSKLMLYIW